MKTPLPNDQITKEASDAVVEFALMAFEPEYLLWDASTNAALVEFVWNAGDPEGSVLASGSCFPDARMEQLHGRLMRARRTRFGHCRFSVLDLVPGTEDGHVVFSFRLSWDGGETGRDCRMVVDFPVEGDAPEPMAERGKDAPRSDRL